MVSVCPPWMEPEAGLMLEITIWERREPRLLTALPTPPFLLKKKIVNETFW